MKPQIREYMSVATYLQDYYQYRKEENSGFSYEAWAAELGFKSRSFLTMILNQQRNITSTVADSLKASLNLSLAEQEYFQLLVKYSQAEESSEKEMLLDKMFEHLGQSESRQEILHYQEFLAAKELPKLLVLLSFKDLDRSLQGISQFLRAPLAEVTENLSRLQAMGLIVEQVSAGTAKMEWVATKKSFRVPRNFGCESLETYHNHCLLEAIDAQKLPAHLRRYRSLLLPLSEEDYLKLNEDINMLVAKARSKYDDDTLTHKRLYKLNINVIPVSETHEESFTDLRPELDC